MFEKDKDIPLVYMEQTNESIDMKNFKKSFYNTKIHPSKSKIAWEKTNKKK